MRVLYVQQGGGLGIVGLSTTISDTLFSGNTAGDTDSVDIILVLSCHAT